MPRGHVTTRGLTPERPVAALHHRASGCDGFGFGLGLRADRLSVEPCEDVVGGALVREPAARIPAMASSPPPAQVATHPNVYSAELMSNPAQTT